VIETLTAYFAQDTENLPDWILKISDPELREVAADVYRTNPDRAEYLSMCDTEEQMRGFLASAKREA
jgi:hypothetical protein